MDCFRIETGDSGEYDYTHKAPGTRRVILCLKHIQLNIMKKYFVSILVVALFASCGDSAPATSDAGFERAKPEEKTSSSSNPSYDPERGKGKFTQVELPATLDAAMADKGFKAYQMKCESCHKLTDEKLVGPGWKGVTSRNKPEWIMNFITNTNEMLDVDPKAQAQLEICLVRMPNQSLTDDDARALLEFMRKNDGVK